MAKKQRQQLVRKTSNDTSTGAVDPIKTSLDISVESSIQSVDDQQPPSRTGSSETAAEVNVTTKTHGEGEIRKRIGVIDLIRNEKNGILWIIGCAFLGLFLGFGVGCGWFTCGYGSYEHVVGVGSDGAPTLVREYTVSAWRVALAGKVRNSLAYKIAISDFAADESLNAVESQGFLSWVSTTPFWPPNLVLGQSTRVAVNNLDVGVEVISPMTASFLSFVLPWRRPIIEKLSGNSLSSMSAPPPSQMPSTTPKQTYPIDPYNHPMAFHTLREYVIRHKRGYVHPDLGFIVPAPSGAARGIGMVRNSFNECQINCFPGTTEEALSYSKDVSEDSFPDTELEHKHKFFSSSIPTPKTTTMEEIQDVLHHQATAEEHPFTQQTLMMRIPIEAQITRKTALDILNPLLSDDFKAITPLEQLDDAFLLAILLVHESGLRSRSRFWPYIATLPVHPSCAMHKAWRQSVVDVVTALALGMGTDTSGWPHEIAKASDSMDNIAAGLLHFTVFFQYNTSMFNSHHEALRWSLCQVASRAIAGNEEHGRLRLVPMMDMINHDEAADMFNELKGDESYHNGHFVDAVKEDAGAFVVRSQRHDRRKVLKKGQVSSYFCDITISIHLFGS